MAKKQTRRSISISRYTYDKAKAYAKACGAPLSQLGERMLHTMMSIPAGGVGVLMTMDEADALRRYVAGDSFDSKTIDSAVTKIDKAKELYAMILEHEREHPEIKRAG